MPTCQKCQLTWSWKESIKKTYIVDSAITCPYCGEAQYFTQKSKRNSRLLNATVLLPLLIAIFVDIPGMILLISFPVLFVIIMSIYPFVIEVSSEKDHNYFHNHP